MPLNGRRSDRRPLLTIVLISAIYTPQMAARDRALMPCEYLNGELAAHAPAGHDRAIAQRNVNLTLRARLPRLHPVLTAGRPLPTVTHCTHVFDATIAGLFMPKPGTGVARGQKRKNGSRSLQRLPFRM
jgi:hypothetical protein